MKTIRFVGLMAALTATLLIGCVSTPPGVEHGPQGTIPYEVLIDATPPGARIVANGADIGLTPVRLKIYGDKDGTFHDFGSYYYVVQAMPLTTNQFPQARYFHTGRWFSPEDRIPQRIDFNMDQPAMPLGPPYAYPYYPPPVYYGPPPYYYGPGYYHRWY